MIRRLIILLLIVGCGTEPEEDLANCVLRGSGVLGQGIFIRYECYENVYTKKECMDKDKDGATYYEYVTESCSNYGFGSFFPVMEFPPPFIPSLFLL